MTTETAAKLQKVQKYSASLRSLFGFFFVMGLLVWLIGTIIFLSEGFDPPARVAAERIVRIGNAAYRGDAITAVVLVMGKAYSTLGVAIALKLTFHLASLFGLYATGKIFAAENVRQIRQIGITLLLFPALGVLGVFAPLLVPAESISSVVGPPVFVQFMGAIQGLIFGLIVIMVSWIMDVGRELREEQDLVV